jgi:mono/diheme cytochrome c family protein
MPVGGECVRIVRSFAVAALIATGVGAMTSHSFAQSAPGPYTAAQAAAGAKLYGDNCASCHGAKLEGDVGPALAGDAFISQWPGQTADDVYAEMSTQMPATAPGSLKPAEYLALLAYVLQQNGYPAGPAALDPAKLKTIKIVAQKS